jgi:hypothetical protein
LALDNGRIFGIIIPAFDIENAGVAHLVERHLAKVEVASPSLVTRSKNSRRSSGGNFFMVGKDLRIFAEKDCRPLARDFRGGGRENRALPG